MKKILIILFGLLIYNLTFNIENCKSQWVQMSNGMGTGQVVQCLAISGNNIFASTIDSGVYLSSNNGTNWTKTALNNVNVQCLTTLGSNIFAGAGGSGVYLSTNNGTNWIQTSLNNQIVNSLATLGNIVFAGTSYGIYLTTNNGTNWTQTALNQPVRSFATLGNNIFAGTANPSGISGVYLSTNNGTNWTQAGLNDKYIFSLATNGNNIFAGTDIYGVYLSTNNGINWTQTALNNNNIQSLAVSGNNIFAGLYPYSVYLSSNNGTNWIQKNQGFNNPLPTVRALLITNTYIFAGTYGQSVWRRPFSEIIGIQNISSNIPNGFQLEQNYPNPFNPTTKIRFDVTSGFSIGTLGNDRVVLKVYDVMGREVQTLVNESLKPGTYEASFDGSQFTSDVYFYKLITKEFSETRRMLLVK